MLSPARFTRQQRLIQSADFGRVFSQPIRSVDRYFTVLARPGTCDNSRLGLAISKKAEKLAVARNCLKRLIREVFRQTELPALDFVIMSKRGSSTFENKVLIESLQQHFSRIVSKVRTQRRG
jgi:ribonuclease P protein component